jgi:hypothetical protein
MPYVRAEHGYRGGDRFPRWSNIDEAQAAVQALSLLRVAGENGPSLAVLSPYREQVKLLKEKINASLGVCLSHLSGFKPAVGGGEYCGTVDSFQLTRPTWSWSHWCATMDMPPPRRHSDFLPTIGA